MATTPENEAIRELNSKLVTEVKKSLTSIVGVAHTRGLITDDQKAEIFEKQSTNRQKADTFMGFIIDTVKDSTKLETFCELLCLPGCIDTQKELAQELKELVERKKRQTVLVKTGMTSLKGSHVLYKPVLPHWARRRLSTTSQSSFEGGTDSLTENERSSGFNSESESDTSGESIPVYLCLQNAVRHLPQRQLTKEERCNLAFNLGLPEEDLKDKVDLQSVCTIWMLKCRNGCCIEDLVYPLICTRGLGRFVSGIPTASHNPPDVKQFFYSLHKNWHTMATYLGYTNAELKCKGSEQQQIEHFLNMFRMPNCGARNTSFLRDSLHRAEAHAHRCGKASTRHQSLVMRRAEFNQPNPKVQEMKAERPPKNEAHGQIKSETEDGLQLPVGKDDNTAIQSSRNLYLQYSGKPSMLKKLLKNYEVISHILYGEFVIKNVPMTGSTTAIYADINDLMEAMKKHEREQEQQDTQQERQQMQREQQQMQWEQQQMQWKQQQMEQERQRMQQEQQKMQQERQRMQQEWQQMQQERQRLQRERQHQDSQQQEQRQEHQRMQLMQQEHQRMQRMQQEQHQEHHRKQRMQQERQHQDSQQQEQHQEHQRMQQERQHQDSQQQEQHQEHHRMQRMQQERQHQDSQQQEQHQEHHRMQQERQRMQQSLQRGLTSLKEANAEGSTLGLRAQQPVPPSRRRGASKIPISTNRLRSESPTTSLITSSTSRAIFQRKEVQSAAQRPTTEGLISSKEAKAERSTLGLRAKQPVRPRRHRGAPKMPISTNRLCSESPITSLMTSSTSQVIFQRKDVQSAAQRLTTEGGGRCRLHVLSPFNPLPPDRSIFVFVSISRKQEYQRDFEKYLREEHSYMRFHPSTGRSVRFCAGGRAVFCMQNPGGLEVQAEEGIEEILETDVEEFVPGPHHPLPSINYQVILTQENALTRNLRLFVSATGIEEVGRPGVEIKEIPVILTLDVPLQPAVHQQTDGEDEQIDLLLQILSIITKETGERWCEIGLELGYSENDLEEIRRKHSKNATQCCERMLKKWVKRENAYWWKLLDALRRVNPDTANKVESILKTKTT